MSIKKIGSMSFQLQVLDPYIVTFHHHDLFPLGNGKMGPKVMPRGKNNGDDFDHHAPWRMYYGSQIPGFPVHPHRGFETVTVMVEGFADHFDAKGSKGRYGEGDVQWMTAGSGTQHSEMFPLLKDDAENPMELFQIWLNLSQKEKFATPDYKMFWNEDIPVVKEKDELGRITEIKIIAGEYKGVRSPDAPSASWANNRENHVGIWLVKLDPHASLTIPAISGTLNRMLYHYRGEIITIEEKEIKAEHYVELDGGKETHVINGEETAYLLLLEGEPIGEPVAAYGPFVMNTQNEVRQAYEDYRKTQFGGWPWEQDDPVNGKDEGRFASYHLGERVEYPPKKG